MQSLISFHAVMTTFFFGYTCWLMYSSNVDIFSDMGQIKFFLDIMEILTS